MRQRKRRLWTALLCAVLIMSNVLSAGMPVYAKSPDAGSDSMSTVYSNETVSPMTENGAAETPDASSDTDKQTGEEAGDNADSGNMNGNTTDSGSESAGGDSNDSDADTGSGSGDSNSGIDDASDDTPANGDESKNDDTNIGDDTDTEDDPAEGDTPNAEEDSTVSGNDIEGDGTEEDTPSSISLYGDGDYLTEDPKGYNLTDITMTPGSYSAEFSAGSEKYIYETYYFKVIYTAEPSLANDFFKGKSKITETELSDSSFRTGEFINLGSRWDNSSDGYKLSGTFMGDSSLTPDTTYCYRLAYSGYDYTESQFCYYFLTLPDQFTTGGPVTESSISIRDVSVEEIGYQRAKIVWTIDNPNKEVLLDMRLVCRNDEGTQHYDIPPSEYQDKDYNTVPNKYYATVDLNGADWVRKLRVTLTTYIGAGEEKNITSDEITITPKDINDAAIKLTSKIGTGSLQALVELSPYYHVDNSIWFDLYYKKATDSSWKSTNGYAYGSTGSTSASVMLQASDLSANTEYEYYIKPSGRLGERTYENLGTEDNPLTFTTKEIVTYEDTEFPDAVFRNYIKEKINIKESDKITSDKLEKLTAINYDRSSASGNISSLQGIEHIENLTNISFSGHTITDVGGLGTLTALTNIYLQSNDLTELPDLSGMSQLTYAYFKDNRINADTIIEAKLPVSLLTRNPDWITDTKRSQRAEIEVTLAPEYYVSGDARPFLIKVTGLKDSRRYTLSLTIDGKTVSGTAASHSYYEVYYIKDILKDSVGADTGITVTPGTPCQATITLTDNYGNEWLNQTEPITFAAADAITSVVKTQHIRPNESQARVEIENLPATYTKDSIAGLTLYDQKGTPVGSASASSIYIDTSNYNPYEDVFGYFYIYDLTNGSSTRLYATVYFAKYLSAGYYNAVVTATDGTSATYEKAVCVDDAAVVDYLSTATDNSNQYYDNYGDYLYVRMSGANIDPTKVRPIFYENGEDITECISVITSGYDCQEAVYKLKKLKKDTYWNISDWKTFTYRIQADDGYTVIDNIRDKSIPLYAPSEGRDFVTFEHYNYKKGVYEVKTDSTVTNGTKVSVSVCNNSSSQVLMGTAQGEITNSLLSLDFKNEQGESYAPPKDKEAYFIYTYTDSAGNEKRFTHTNYSVKWYNYYAGSTSSGKSAYSSTILYHKALLKKLDLNVSIPTEKVQAGQKIDAQIYTRAGSAVDGGKVALAGKSSNGYINYTGTWQDSVGLEEGIYQIRYSQNSIQLYSHNIYVYDDEKFYMNSQWMSEWSDSSGEGICFTFSSERLAGNYIHDHNRKVDAKTALAHWNNGDYKLELLDRLGNPVSGWKADHASWSGSNFYVYLKDVPKGYVGYYAKLTKSGRLGIRLDDGTVYYSTAYDADEEHGEWETISSNRNVWFNDNSTTNAYYGFGSYAYPVTVTITKPYDTDVIHAFTVSAATSGYYYDFTAADLKNIDPKETYRITAVSVDGSSRSEIGYLAVRGTSTVVNATGINLNKTTLNMQLNQTEKLTAAVKPDNATNKNVSWTSDNTSVATVGTDGTVTAMSVGTAKITATTHNGKTAVCTVQVFNYTLSRTELTFDLSTETAAQPVALKVSDGTNDISSSVTWSSNDESVATVTKGGVVTPEGAGTAKILAEVKNGPTLECNVTVSRDTLTGVTLNESECTLYLDSKGQPVSQMPNTKQLKLYLTPSDTKVDNIIWTSDQPTVASVAADADDPAAAVVTAQAKGTAKITAAVTTKSGTKTAECAISVQTVTTADGLDIPSGLTALTNEQLTLDDVDLPAGWEWMYPDVSLKQFAGMQAKAFAAQYKDPADPNAVPYETELSVALSTVTGIAIGADSNSLHLGTDTMLSVIWNMNGSQLDLSSYADRVTWSSTKESVATVQPTSGAATKLTAQGTGKTTVKAQVSFKDGKTYKAQYNVTVVDGEIAVIQITAVDNFKPDADQPSAYRGKLDSEPGSNNGTVHVTVTGATKLAVKNNNAKVITTGKVTAEENGYNIPLTIKAAGMAKITLTANDKAKTQKDIFLYVTDVKPNISEDTVTVNLWQTTGTAFTLYPNEGYQVMSADLAGDNASKFTLTKAAAQADATRAEYVITAKDGTAKGSYKLTLQGKVKSGTDEYDYNNVAFTVKVVEQAPKYKIKQSAKVNLFYKNWENSILEVTSDEVLESMELTGCDFTVENPTGAWRVKAGKADLTTNCNKKGALQLRFVGYKDVTANFTVGVEKKAPTCTLRNKSMTVYPAAGLDSAVLNPLVYRPDGNLYGDVIYSLDNKTANAGFRLMHENPDQTGDFLIKYTGGSENLKNATYKASFTLTHDTWTDQMTVPFTIKVNGGKPAAKLGKTTLQLNTNAASMAYDTAATTVMWKDGAKFDPLHVSVSAADAKSRGIINTGVVFTFDRTGDQVIAKLNNTAVAKGNYKFKVNVKVTDTLTVSTPLTIKIVDVDMDKAIRVSVKGSIDVLNREGTSVTATPALKSLNGNIVDVRLSGRAAHLFSAECADNKVVIHAKSDVALITKYNYKVKLNLTIKNAEGDTIRYITPEINLKLKQGKPKVAIAPKNAALFSGSYENITRNISATLKGAENPVITNVELMNNSDAFTCEYTDGVITLHNTPNAIKGKSYSLQFRVTFNGQADNEKATIVKYTVKVK